MTDKKSIPIYVGKKVVGNVVGDVFVKRLYKSKHFLYSPPAIAFDVPTLNDAVSHKAKHVLIVDMESGKKYCARISTITERGFIIDRGHGKQIALEMKYWDNEITPYEQPSFTLNKETIV